MVSFEAASQAGQDCGDNANQESSDLYLRSQATCHLKRTYPIIGLTKHSGGLAADAAALREFCASGTNKAQADAESGSESGP